MMLKDSFVVGVRVPNEEVKVFRLAQYKAKRLGIPFYKLFTAILDEFVSERTTNDAIINSLQAVSR